jgi:hypothetical protein
MRAATVVVRLMTAVVMRVAARMQAERECGVATRWGVAGPLQLQQEPGLQLRHALAPQALAGAATTTPSPLTAATSR